MIPTNFEILDHNKYFELYYNQELELQSHMNFLFKKNTFNKIMDNVLSFMREKYNININQFDSNMVFSIVMYGGNKDVLLNLLGRGKNTIRLGEGRASVYFLKINGKIVMLFLDSRGMSIEIEPTITQDEYKDIMTDLFEFLYEGCERYDEQLINYINKFKN